MPPPTAVLGGRGVLLCRPAEQAAPLADALVALGARVVVLPLIEVAWTPLEARRAGLERLAAASWLVVTSVNGAASLADALARTGVGPPAGLAVAAVGPATARALTAAGMRVRAGAGAGSAAALAEELLPHASGGRFLLWQGNLAAPLLAERLRAAGAEVATVVGYRTVETEVDVSPVRQDIEAGAIDAVIFASPSQVRAAVGRLGTRALGRLAVVAMGPSTARAVLAAGLRVDAQAEAPRVDALAAAVVRALRAGERP